MRKEEKELLLQAYETELGGVKIYETALKCATNDDLKKEWKKYHEQTKEHVEILEGVLDKLNIEASDETPGREVVKHIGESLVKAMEMAIENAEPEEAQVVAAECVVLAETKDHMNWHLIGEVAKAEDGGTDKDRLKKRTLKDAYDQVESQEDEHLYHTRGWTRELWIDTLGMPAVLPPPEEEKDVKTEIGAARAAKARTAEL